MEKCIEKNTHYVFIWLHYNVFSVFTVVVSQHVFGFANKNVVEPHRKLIRQSDRFKQNCLVLHLVLSIGEGMRL